MFPQFYKGFLLHQASVFKNNGSSALMTMDKNNNDKNNSKNNKNCYQNTVTQKSVLIGNCNKVRHIETCVDR